MLNKIRLTNFQRHRHLEVVFNGGLTALRGANEAGKSTLLRAICYALFGVKGLGATLEDLVTWGEEPKSLKVELELGVDGVVYTIKRGKSGAEVNYDGGTVTGQNEVTAFVCRLLKADPVAATRLILAKQGGIRGALEAGAAETTKLIERLAEFDQIDNLIEQMQEELTLGSTATVEAAIAAAERQLDEARTAAVEPDLEDLNADIERATEDIDIATKLQQEAQEKADAANKAYNDGKVAAAEVAALDREVNGLSDRIIDVETELKELKATPAPDNVDIAALRQQIDDAKRIGELRKKFEKVEPYIRTKSHDKFAANEFKGTIEALEQDIENVRAAREVHVKVREKASTDARLLRQQIADGSCSFCGQDFSNVPEVKEKNAHLTRQAEEADGKARLAEQQISLADAEIKRLQGILAASRPVLKVLDVVGDVARLEDDVLPPFLVWTGPEITDQEDDVEDTILDLKLKIKDAEDQQRAFERASAKIETLTAERARLYTEREDAYGRRARGPNRVDIDALRAAAEAARDALRPLQDALTAAQREYDQAVRAKTDAIANYERAKASVKAAEAALRERREELDELEFNNALLKRVRQCRPLIADQLWNLVLNAVSTYFSDMRGVPSKVRKTTDAFTVDGHPVTGETISGSTLDILGLAIRVALVRTFMPMSPFLILDEPAAACDDGRTNNMLGFLATAGFKQVLLVTHEDISQAVADNMITL